MTDSSNHPTVVNLSGEYDIGRRDELDNLLDRYGDVDPLVFNLAGVDRFDTSALRSLMRFQRARQEAGKAPFVLRSASERVRQFFELAQVPFRIEDDLA
jgi:anti-anti-sigma factor